MPDNSTPTPPSDEQLAARAQQGCAKSFEELVRRYQVPLVHFLRQRGPDDEAEDVAQEAFIRAYENLARYRPRWRFSTWLFTIARRLSVNRRRRSRARRRTRRRWNRSRPPRRTRPTRRPRAKVAADCGTRPRTCSAKSRSRPCGCITSRRCRSEQIARVLGRFTPAVKTMLHRARKKLLARLEGSCLHEPDGGDAGREPSRRCPRPRS